MFSKRAKCGNNYLIAKINDICLTEAPINPQLLRFCERGPLGMHNNSSPLISFLYWIFESEIQVGLCCAADPGSVQCTQVGLQKLRHNIVLSPRTVPVTSVI